MAARIRACNKNEFIYLINQTLDEVEDLRAAIEFDEEFMGNSEFIVEPVSTGLARLLVALESGEYRIGQGDWLDFLNALQNTDHKAFPFWPLLKLILETHQHGYQQRTE